MSASRQTSIRIVNEVSPDDAALIDSLAKDRPDYDKAKLLVKNYDAAVKSLVEKYNEGQLPEVVSQVQSENHILEIGAAGTQRIIKNIARLVQILTPEIFLQLAKINIGDIEKYVPAHLLDEVLETKPSATRSTKIMKRAA